MRWLQWQTTVPSLCSVLQPSLLQLPALPAPVGEMLSEGAPAPHMPHSGWETGRGRLAGSLLALLCLLPFSHGESCLGAGRRCLQVGSELTVPPSWLWTHLPAPGTQKTQVALEASWWEGDGGGERWEQPLLPGEGPPPPPLDAKKHPDPDARREKSYLSQLRREHNVGDPPHPQSLAVASITGAHSGALLTSTRLCQNWISTGCPSPVTALFCRKAPRMWLFSTELFCSSCKSQGSCGECLKTPGCHRSPKGHPTHPRHPAGCRQCMAFGPVCC